MIHICLSFSRKSKRWKSKDVGIVGGEISLINSVLVRIKCLKSVDIVEDASIARSEKMLKLKFNR